ncbi:MAG: zinc-ribbon domain-containing protein [Gaiellaceae bacterium]
MAQSEQEPRCPRCGTPYVEGQEYCLECGARLPSRGGLVGRLGSAWRKRLGWYPGDWIWPAILALLIAAAAGAGSAFWLADRSSASDQTVIYTSPTSSPLPTTAAPEPTTTQQTETTVTTPTTPTTVPKPPRPTPVKQLISWPSGRSGWTVVLDSLPAPSGRGPAFVEARQALALGMKRVGVLDSSQYSSLHPGYFVVFSGIYGSQAEAQSAIIDAHQHSFSGAYPRRITP